MGDSGENTEDQNAIRNVDSKGYAHEILDVNKDSIGNWAKDHSFYSVEKFGCIISMS